MQGLDAWITGEGCCTYCGQRQCVCQEEREEETMPQAYKVEARGEGCPTCQHGDQFDIVGPDGSAQSQSWGDVEEADYICELMNDAYAVGRASYAQEILDKLKEETGNAEAESEAIEPPPAPSSTDDDIPF